jgi:RNA polymerase sigma-70 factor (ECF subfamily)
MFVCRHPANRRVDAHAAMLQTVLGLDAARIGAAFMVQPATMGQRLTRVTYGVRRLGSHSAQ